MGWKKSSYCGPNGGNCVEAQSDTTDEGDLTAVEVRDSKNSGGPTLNFNTDGWKDFMRFTTAAR